MKMRIGLSTDLFTLAAKRALVRSIILSASRYVWTTQGFGMLRTYLDDAKVWRLNVWDPSRKVPNVSEIHDHPWNFESLVLAGLLINQRFIRASGMPGRWGIGKMYQHARLVTGEGGGVVERLPVSRLLARPLEHYGPGDAYAQQANEVHVTDAMPGTVTLNRRVPARDAHDANVYWLDGDWVSAEPRIATPDEVLAYTSQALKVLT